MVRSMLTKPPEDHRCLSDLNRLLKFVIEHVNPHLIQEVHAPFLVACLHTLESVGSTRTLPPPIHFGPLPHEPKVLDDRHPTRSSCLAVVSVREILVYPDSEGFRAYRAPGWRAAARKIKSNTRIPKETGYIRIHVWRDNRYERRISPRFSRCTGFIAEAGNMRDMHWHP
jgi:hypothetical protein